MPESTLAVNYDDLRGRIAFHRGFRTDKTRWNSDHIEQIEMCLLSGARMFYFPALEPPHSWSFLRLTRSLELQDGLDSIDLPADFGYADSDIYFQNSDTSLACPLKLGNEGKVLLARQNMPDSTGTPIMAAIRPVTSKIGKTEGQRFEVIVYPTADDDYTLTLRYSVLPESITAANPFPWGGAAHAETMIEACLAASEQNLDDMMGIHGQLFQQRLKASVDYDRRTSPSVITPSDMVYGQETVINTYNGQYSTGQS